jgi:hypothetical protein
LDDLVAAVTLVKVEGLNKPTLMISAFIRAWNHTLCFISATEHSIGTFFKKKIEKFRAYITYCRNWDCDSGGYEQLSSAEKHITFIFRIQEQDGGYMFLRNVGTFSADYAALYPRNRTVYFSFLLEQTVLVLLMLRLNNVELQLKRDE